LTIFDILSPSFIEFVCGSADVQPWDEIVKTDILGYQIFQLRMNLVPVDHICIATDPRRPLEAPLTLSLKTFAQPALSGSSTF
jgi:hypothetical protein